MSYSDLPTLLSESDAIVVCCSLNEETRGMFDQEAFRRMRRGAVLINVARGAIINQDDLQWALEVGGTEGGWRWRWAVLVALEANDVGPFY